MIALWLPRQSERPVSPFIGRAPHDRGLRDTLAPLGITIPEAGTGSGRDYAVEVPGMS